MGEDVLPSPAICTLDSRVLHSCVRHPFKCASYSQCPRPCSPTRTRHTGGPRLGDTWTQWTQRRADPLGFPRAVRESRYQPQPRPQLRTRPCTLGHPHRECVRAVQWGRGLASGRGRGAGWGPGAGPGAPGSDAQPPCPPHRQRCGGWGWRWRRRCCISRWGSCTTCDGSRCRCLPCSLSSIHCAGARGDPRFASYACPRCPASASDRRECGSAPRASSSEPGSPRGWSLPRGGGRCAGQDRQSATATAKWDPTGRRGPGADGAPQWLRAGRGPCGRRRTPAQGVYPAMGHGELGGGGGGE